MRGIKEKRTQIKIRKMPKGAFEEMHKSMVVGFCMNPVLKLSTSACDSPIRGSFARDGLFCIEGDLILCELFPVAALDASMGSFFPLASLFGADLSHCDTFQGCLKAVATADSLRAQAPITRGEKRQVS